MTTPQVWNTGRKYSAKGQRIAAIKMNDGKVAFADVDRYVIGITLTECETEDVQRFVMQEYDQGNYSHIPHTHRSLELWLIKEANSI